MDCIPFMSTDRCHLQMSKNLAAVCFTFVQLAESGWKWSREDGGGVSHTINPALCFFTALGIFLYSFLWEIFIIAVFKPWVYNIGRNNAAVLLRAEKKISSIKCTNCQNLTIFLKVVSVSQFKHCQIIT